MRENERKWTTAARQSMIDLAGVVSRTVRRLQMHTVDVLESTSEWRLLWGSLLK